MNLKLLCACVALSLSALPLGVRAQTVAPDSPTVAPDSTAPALPSVAPDAQPGVAPIQELPVSEVLFPNGLFEAALRAHVSKSGDIDYPRLKDNAYLNRYVAAVGVVDRAKFPVVTLPPLKEGDPPRLNRSFETAYLINAHNALLIKALADAYPVNSPDEVKGLMTDKRFNVAGKTVSLQELRDEIVAREPRAYFALLTGTRGGPASPQAPYTFSTLNPMLDAAVRAYVDDQRHVNLLRIENRVSVDSFMQGADALFAPKNARGERSRGKWDGVKFLLKTYTGAKPSRNYFNTSEFKVQWLPTNTALNYSSASSPVGASSGVTIAQ